MLDKQEEILDAMYEIKRINAFLEYVIHYAEEAQKNVTRTLNMLEELKTQK
jgi:hypothetical protein